MRLLIAEDGLDLAEALTVFFEKNQFSVDTVHDGFAAYDYASTGEYDAIVLDVMMPKMDGVQVLQRLREEGVRTPVMMLTARSGKDDRITGFNAGADDYLPKPFEPDELDLPGAGHAPAGRDVPAHSAGLRGCDAGSRFGGAVLLRPIRAAQRTGVSGDGAVPALTAGGAVGGSHHGAGLGLGQ